MFRANAEPVARANASAATATMILVFISDLLWWNGLFRSNAKPERTWCGEYWLSVGDFAVRKITAVMKYFIRRTRPPAERREARHGAESDEHRGIRPRIGAHPESCRSAPF